MKRYIDVYSASSLIGFSYEDLLQIANIYAQAEENWSHSTKRLLLHKNESSDSLLPALKTQIDLFVNFQTMVAELARSKWTEFNLKMMGIGFGIMLVSLLIHFFSIKRVARQHGASFTSCGDSGISFGLIVACFVVVIRASSFLSNSYICKLSVSEFALLYHCMFRLYADICNRFSFYCGNLGISGRRKSCKFSFGYNWHC